MLGGVIEDDARSVLHPDDRAAHRRNRKPAIALFALPPLLLAGLLSESRPRPRPSPWRATAPGPAASSPRVPLPLAPAQHRHRRRLADRPRLPRRLLLRRPRRSQSGSTRRRGWPRCPGPTVHLARAPPSPRSASTAAPPATPATSSKPSAAAHLRPAGRVLDVDVRRSLFAAAGGRRARGAPDLQAAKCRITATGPGASPARSLGSTSTPRPPDVHLAQARRGDGACASIHGRRACRAAGAGWLVPRRRARNAARTGTPEDESVSWSGPRSARRPAARRARGLQRSAKPRRVRSRAERQVKAA